MDFQWLKIAKRLEEIAQAGLTYSENDYDKERYAEVRQIGCQILHTYSGTPEERIHDLFSKESGYPTPKVDVRGVVFRGKKILMVQEKLDGLWALPGGWADIGYSPGKVVIKEMREESGLEVVPERLIAIMDKKCRALPPSPLHVYKIFLLCRETGGLMKAGVETLNAAFFDQTHLPDLSVDRNTGDQIREMFDYQNDPTRLPYFD